MSDNKSKGFLQKLKEDTSHLNPFHVIMFLLIASPFLLFAYMTAKLYVLDFVEQVRHFFS